jgi:hypothetical protein
LELCTKLSRSLGSMRILTDIFADGPQQGS